MSDLFLATELEEAHIECTFPGEKNRNCRSEANPSWVSISGYDVCCFNTSLPFFFPFLLLFLLLFKSRQTDRARGLYLPSCDLRLSSKEKNIAFVDFFWSISLFAALFYTILWTIPSNGFAVYNMNWLFFQQHAAISNYFGSSLLECQRLKKTTDASCWALSCKWHLTAWALQLPAKL